MSCPLLPSARITEGGKEISPALPIVVPGTITALPELSLLQGGIGIGKISFFNGYPPGTFLLIQALVMPINAN